MSNRSVYIWSIIYLWRVTWVKSTKLMNPEPGLPICQRSAIYVTIHAHMDR